MTWEEDANSWVGRCAFCGEPAVGVNLGKKEFPEGLGMVLVVGTCGCGECSTKGWLMVVGGEYLEQYVDSVPGIMEEGRERLDGKGKAGPKTHRKGWRPPRGPGGR